MPDLWELSRRWRWPLVALLAAALVTAVVTVGEYPSQRGLPLSFPVVFSLSMVYFSFGLHLVIPVLIVAEVVLFLWRRWRGGVT